MSLKFIYFGKRDKNGNKDLFDIFASYSYKYGMKLGANITSGLASIQKVLNICCNICLSIYGIRMLNTYK